MAADTWYSDQGEPPHDGPMGFADWMRVVRRGVPLVVIVVTGLLLMLVVRLVERPLCGAKRPVTPYITVAVCRMSLRILGIRHRVIGAPMQSPGAVVANHASWLDIFALNAAQRIYFVAKSEVAGWAGIGWLARATGTVFVIRDRKQATAQVAMFKTRLAAGHKLLFFPEGTSTDGQRVLPFKPTLFASFFDPGLRETMQVQAATVRYCVPAGADPRLYGWWGGMDLAPHLLSILVAPVQGVVEVVFQPPVAVKDFPDRKALAAHTEALVRQGLTSGGDRGP